MNAGFRPVGVGVSVLVLALVAGPALALDEVAPGCGALENSYGPFDYRDSSKKANLLLVEKFHFTPDVESLTKADKHELAGNIDYTLRAFPNHHRALMSLLNLAAKMGKLNSKMVGNSFPVECYFIRAEAFRPEDAAVKMIYGFYLLKLGQQQKAVGKLEAAKAIAANDPNIYYNLGLAYVELKQYDKALENAHRAYALGFPLPGLKNLLVKAGAWHEEEGSNARAIKQRPGTSGPPH
jgi:tetratricopeptide (TPR) repeat protein